MSALAEIVGASVDNNGALLRLVSMNQNIMKERTYANDALRSNELDQLVLNASLGITLCIGLEVTKVTNVALLVLRGAVGLVVGVDCR